MSFVLALIFAMSPQAYESSLHAGAELFEAQPANDMASRIVETLTPVTIETQDGEWPIRDRWLESARTRYGGLADKERAELATEIARHLRARAAEVAKGLSPTTVVTASDTVLENILADEAFEKQRRPPALSRAAARIRNWFKGRWEDAKAFFRRLFRRDSDKGGLWERLRGLLSRLGADIAVGFIVYFIVKALAGTTSLGAEIPPDLEMPEEPPAAAEMMHAAQTFTEQGEHRAAMRALYLALLGALHAAGRISYDRHRTNREYSRELSGSTDAPVFSTAVELFDRKWYGREVCTGTDVAAMQVLFRQLAPPASEAA